MTQPEFEEWLLMHQNAFPEVRLWLRDCDPVATLTLWREALATVSLEQAKRVTMRMLTGEIDHPDRWSCSKLPGLIRSNSPRNYTLEELQKHWNPHTGMEGAP